MRTYVCAVFDVALQAYAQPVHFPSTGVALRQFSDEVNRQYSDDRPNPLNQHSEDFEFWLLSEYDDSTGQFLNNSPSLLARGKEVKQ